MKGLHKSLCNAARAAAAAAASAATANLKRQDKCDNLSAFWTAGTPATWHKINVKQNGETAKAAGGAAEVGGAAGRRSRQEEQIGAAGGQMPAEASHSFPFAASASLSAKNCCKMMWAVPDRLGLAWLPS